MRDFSPAGRAISQYLNLGPSTPPEGINLSTLQTLRDTATAHGTSTWHHQAAGWLGVEVGFSSAAVEDTTLPPPAPLIAEAQDSFANALDAHEPTDGFVDSTTLRVELAVAGLPIYEALITNTLGPDLIYAYDDAVAEVADALVHRAATLDPRRRGEHALLRGLGAEIDMLLGYNRQKKQIMDPGTGVAVASTLRQDASPFDGHDDSVRRNWDLSIVAPRTKPRTRRSKSNHPGSLSWGLTDKVQVKNRPEPPFVPTQRKPPYAKDITLAIFSELAPEGIDVFDGLRALAGIPNPSMSFDQQSEVADQISQAIHGLVQRDRTAKR
jgi:hypothetical protein